MIYFAADVHLGTGIDRKDRSTERRFNRWLDHIAADAEAIFLLGDLFDFWFEYRRVVPQGFVRTLGRIAALTDRGVRVVLITGNHDMWVGDYLRRECGVELYTEPRCFDLGGRRLFLAHGDNMNIGRRPALKLMNTVFRSKVIRRLFSWLVHPDLAVRFGRWWSDSSRKSHGKSSDNPEANRPLDDYARNYLKHNPSVDGFLFGHMHCAEVAEVEGREVIHLGEWSRAGSFATLDASGCLTLKTFES